MGEMKKRAMFPKDSWGKMIFKKKKTEGIQAPHSLQLTHDQRQVDGGKILELVQHQIHHEKISVLHVE